MNFSIINQFVILIFPFFLILSGIFDFLKLIVPYKINIVGFVLFFPVAYYTTIPVDAFITHVFVFFALLILGFIAQVFKIFGGGDAKFIAVIGLWIGFDPLWDFLLYTVIFGGLLAILILISGRFLPHSYQPESLRLMIARRVVPYASAMAMGGLSIYQETVLWSLLMAP